ncbi:N-acetyltransferase [Streptomyces sp. NBC_00237]|uniref:N-acetyltransferase n=1 Tax=Streptomyces sp. NBC_00237 TaxID=2975687 RepID=UPI002254AD0B|nr:N-acetyltransferase [Streptomyces sp. NBC_00237]MCX5203116.1 N-acetyltransferase [Streptomyces sp. NBC_00237]
MTDETLPPRPFVPAGFVAPRLFETESFRLVPLAPEHNAGDLAAWTSSIGHIRRTPGFSRSWPPEDGMSAAENLGDVEGHLADFAAGRGFTFTVLDPAVGDAVDVIGCVYVYPDWDDPSVTSVRSWVRADRAALDGPLVEAVREWLEAEWPFTRISYR